MNDATSDQDIFQIADIALARLEKLGKCPQGAIADLPDIPGRPLWQDNADLFLERLRHHCLYIGECAQDLAEKFRALTELDARLRQNKIRKDAPAHEMLRSSVPTDAAFALHCQLDDEAQSISQLERALQQAIYLRFANLKLAFEPQKSSNARHDSVETRIKFPKDAVAHGDEIEHDPKDDLATLEKQAEQEKKAWDKIRKRRGLYLRTIFDGFIPETLNAFMNDAEQRNSIAHADERIDHGTYHAPTWGRQEHGSIDSIVRALTQLADAAGATRHAVFKYRGRLSAQHDEH